MTEAKSGEVSDADRALNLRVTELLTSEFGAGEDRTTGRFPVHSWVLLEHGIAILCRNEVLDVRSSRRFLRRMAKARLLAAVRDELVLTKNHRTAQRDPRSNDIWYLAAEGPAVSTPKAGSTTPWNTGPWTVRVYGTPPSVAAGSTTTSTTTGGIRLEEAMATHLVKQWTTRALKGEPESLGIDATSIDPSPETMITADEQRDDDKLSQAFASLRHVPEEEAEAEGDSGDEGEEPSMDTGDGKRAPRVLPSALTTEAEEEEPEEEGEGDSEDEGDESGMDAGDVKRTVPQTSTSSSQKPRLYLLQSEYGTRVVVYGRVTRAQALVAGTKGAHRKSWTVSELAWSESTAGDGSIVSDPF